MTDEWDDQIDEMREQLRLVKARLDLSQTETKPQVPTLAKFVLGPAFLNQTKIYPKQLTMLRILFCELEGLTAFDHQVLEEWGSGFEKRPLEPGATSWHHEPARDTEFTMGTTPDLLERMRANRAAGRRWFREFNGVIGRRGGKGHLGSLACARLVWELLALGDPHSYFGIPQNKRIAIPIFAGNREQARFNLFGDIAGLLIDAPCFAPYVQAVYRDRLIIATPADLARPDRLHEGSIEILAKETTSSAGRGPATIAQFYDEMAFIDPATSQASAEAVYDAATPALDQFGEWAMLAELLQSPPDDRRVLRHPPPRPRLDTRTGTAAYPEIVTVQLPSWVPYERCEEATEIPMVTQAEADADPEMSDERGRPRCFPPTGRAITTNDLQMGQHQKAKGRAFRVERLAQWDTSAGSFFDRDDVEAMFGTYKGVILKETTQPPHATKHVIAVDPAIKHDPFTWIVGHLDPVDDRGRPHLVLDALRRWVPEEHGGELDIDLVLDALLEDIGHFRAVQVVTDQYGGPFVVQQLNRKLGNSALNPFSIIREQAWSQPSKLAAANLVAEGLALGQIHSPPDPQLRLELLFLEQTGNRIAAPTSGPVQTDDHAMALFLLAQELLGEAAAQPVHEAMSGTTLHAMRSTASSEDREMFDRMGAASRRTTPVKVGERPYPGGPKMLPRWPR
ncbi:hypothetical protein ACE2AJ_14565 [Aquihabitans daechungensis]|uniref:hypothetical protein n=1 Tax=Aquihabitans daechungensis TaxID=1052257 RepID=UPI003BA2F7FF